MNDNENLYNKHKGLSAEIAALTPETGTRPIWSRASGEGPPPLPSANGSSLSYIRPDARYSAPRFFNNKL